MADHGTSTLSQLVLATKDGDWGQDSPSEGYTPYRVIRGADFPSARHGDISTIPLRYLNALTVERRTVRPNDIIIETAGGSRDRSTGRTLLITESLLSRIGGAVTCASFARFLRIDNHKADPRFIYWYLQNLHALGAMWEHQVQHTGVARFQYTRFAATHEILLPERPVQDAVADVLSALDEKITANGRLAGTSDELIRQRYAKVSSGANETIKIGDLATRVNDTVPADSLGSKDNYIGLEHMPRRNIWLAEWDTAATVASAKTRFRRGDVLFGKLRPYFHKVGITFVDGVASTDILVIHPKRYSVHGWLLAALSSDNIVAHASAIGDGTRMPRAKWSDLVNCRVPWPGGDRAQEFNQLVMPLFDRIGSAVAENRALVELRNALLPRLMSGEIRVRDAEKVVEDMT
jgi:type I restriction enzyme S subunit